MVRVLVVIYSLLLLANPVAAQEKYDHKGQWGLGLGAGFAAASGPHDYKDGQLALESQYALGAWARYHYTQRFAVELGFSNLSFDYERGAFSQLTPRLQMMDLSAAYRMWPTQALHFLIQGGVGAAYMWDMKGVSESDTELILKIRLGLEYMLNSQLMVALYGDFYRVDLGSDLSEGLRLLSPTIGLTYYFGRTSSSATSQQEVKDSHHKCVMTSAGGDVPSSDCDTVIKTNDSDGDGVIDSVDRCAGTAAGQVVNEYGCAKNEKAEFTLNIKFQTGSSRLDPQFVGDLEKFAEFLKKYPEAKLEIEGHTDNTGNEVANFRISESRAKSVVNFMNSKYGIAKNRMSAKGYGPSQPVADNSTAEGRDKNRRVVAHVISP